MNKKSLSADLILPAKATWHTFLSNKNKTKPTKPEKKHQK